MSHERVNKCRSGRAGHKFHMTTNPAHRGALSGDLAHHTEERPWLLSRQDPFAISANPKYLFCEHSAPLEPNHHHTSSQSENYGHRSARLRRQRGCRRHIGPCARHCCISFAPQSESQAALAAHHQHGQLMHLVCLASVQRYAQKLAHLLLQARLAPAPRPHDTRNPPH